MPNTSKNRSTKKKKQSARPLDVFNDPPTPFYLRIALMAGVALFLVWFFCFKDVQRYSISTDKVRQQFQVVLDTVQLPGTQLGSDIRDQGCDTKSSVGLSTRINCSMEGYGYFEITGDKKVALSLANAKLESLGFKKEVDSSYVNQILEGITEGDINYTRPRTAAGLGWATLGTGLKDTDSIAISEALSSHKINPASDNATVVGITLRETYWSCSSSNLDLFGVGCVFPPHSPNK